MTGLDPRAWSPRNEHPASLLGHNMREVLKVMATEVRAGNPILGPSVASAVAYRAMGFKVRLVVVSNGGGLYHFSVEVFRPGSRYWERVDGEPKRQGDVTFVMSL